VVIAEIGNLATGRAVEQPDPWFRNDPPDRVKFPTKDAVQKSYLPELIPRQTA